MIMMYVNIVIDNSELVFQQPSTLEALPLGTRAERLRALVVVRCGLASALARFRLPGDVRYKSKYYALPLALHVE